MVKTKKKPLSQAAKRARLKRLQDKIWAIQAAPDYKMNQWNPEVAELEEQMKDITSGKRRLLVKILPGVNKDFWYRRMIGKTVEVREFIKSDYMVVDQSLRIKKGSINNIGEIMISDCRTVKVISKV